MSQSIPTSLDQLITTSTFAHLADRSESTVRDWDRRGVLRPWHGRPVACTSTTGRMERLRSRPRRQRT